MWAFVVEDPLIGFNYRVTTLRMKLHCTKDEKQQLMRKLDLEMFLLLSLNVSLRSQPAYKRKKLYVCIINILQVKNGPRPGTGECIFFYGKDARLGF